MDKFLLLEATILALFVLITGLFVFVFTPLIIIEVVTGDYDPLISVTILLLLFVANVFIGFSIGTITEDV